MFYGDDPIFHEWCLDYFRYCWENSQVFLEKKLRLIQAKTIASTKQGVSFSQVLNKTLRKVVK